MRTLINYLKTIMKKLITSDLGGHPVYFKDFEFIQEQIREATEAICGDLNPDTVYIFKGCTISVDAGRTVSVSKGYVCFNSEIFAVDTHQAYPASDSDIAVWEVQEEYDTRGNKKFKNEQTKDVFLVRKMKVVYANSSSENPKIANTKKRGFKQELILKNHFKNKKNLTITKDITGTVHLFGVIEDKPSGAGWMNDAIICNIPKEFTPLSVRWGGTMEFKEHGVSKCPCIIEGNKLIRQKYNRYEKDLIFDITYKI